MFQLLLSKKAGLINQKKKKNFILIAKVVLDHEVWKSCRQLLPPKGQPGEPEAGSLRMRHTVTPSKARQRKNTQGNL